MDLSRSGSQALLGALDERLDTMRLGSLDTLAAAALAAEEEAAAVDSRAAADSGAGAGGGAGSGKTGAARDNSSTAAGWGGAGTSGDQLVALPPFLTPLSADSGPGPLPLPPPSCPPGPGCSPRAVGCEGAKEMGPLAAATDAGSGDRGVGLATAAGAPLTVTPFAAVATAAAAAEAAGATPTPPPVAASPPPATVAAEAEAPPRPPPRLFRTPPAGAAVVQAVGLGSAPGPLSPGGQVLRTAGGDTAGSAAVSSPRRKHVPSSGGCPGGGLGSAPLSADGAGGNDSAAVDRGSGSGQLVVLPLTHPLPADLMAPGVRPPLVVPQTAGPSGPPCSRDGGVAGGTALSARSGQDQGRQSQQPRQQQQPRQRTPHEQLQHKRPPESQPQTPGQRRDSGRRRLPPPLPSLPPSLPPPPPPQEQQQRGMAGAAPGQPPQQLSRRPAAIGAHQQCHKPPPPPPPSQQPREQQQQQPPQQPPQVSMLGPAPRAAAHTSHPGSGSSALPALCPPTGRATSRTPGATAQPPSSQQKQRRYSPRQHPVRRQESAGVGRWESGGTAAAAAARVGKTAPAPPSSVQRFGASDGGGLVWSPGEGSDGGSVQRRRPRQAAAHAAATIAAVARDLYGIRDQVPTGGMHTGADRDPPEGSDNGGSSIDDAEDGDAAAAAVLPITPRRSEVPYSGAAGGEGWPPLPPRLPPIPPFRLKVPLPPGASGGKHGSSGIVDGTKRTAAAASPPSAAAVPGVKSAPACAPPCKANSAAARQLEQPPSKMRKVAAPPGMALVANGALGLPVELVSPGGGGGSGLTSDTVAAEAEAAAAAALAAAEEAAAALVEAPRAFRGSDKALQRRERNRLAARKCRAKKMEFIAHMQVQLDSMAARNEELRLQVMTLQRMYTREVQLKEVLKLVVQGCWDMPGSESRLPYTADEVLSGLEAGTMDVTELLGALAPYTAPPSSPLPLLEQPPPDDTAVEEAAAKAAGPHVLVLTPLEAEAAEVACEPSLSQHQQLQAVEPMQECLEDVEESDIQYSEYDRRPLALMGNLAPYRGPEGSTPGTEEEAPVRMAAGVSGGGPGATGQAAEGAGVGFGATVALPVQHKEEPLDAVAAVAEGRAAACAGMAGAVELQPLRQQFEPPRHPPLPPQAAWARPVAAGGAFIANASAATAACGDPVADRHPAACDAVAVVAANAAVPQDVGRGGDSDGGGGGRSGSGGAQVLAAGGRLDSMDMLLAAMAVISSMEPGADAAVAGGGHGVDGDVDAGGGEDGGATGPLAAGAGAAVHGSASQVPYSGMGFPAPQHSGTRLHLMVTPFHPYTETSTDTTAAIATAAASAAPRAMLPAAFNDGGSGAAPPQMPVCGAAADSRMSAQLISPSGLLKPEALSPPSPPYSSPAGGGAGGLSFSPFQQWSDASGGGILPPSSQFYAAALAALTGGAAGGGGGFGVGVPPVEVPPLPGLPSPGSVLSGTAGPPLVTALLQHSDQNLPSTHGDSGLRAGTRVGGAPGLTAPPPHPLHHLVSDLPHADSVTSPPASGSPPPPPQKLPLLMPLLPPPPPLSLSSARPSAAVAMDGGGGGGGTAFVGASPFGALGLLQIAVGQEAAATRRAVRARTPGPHQLQPLIQPSAGVRSVTPGSAGSEGLAGTRSCSGGPGKIGAGGTTTSKKASRGLQAVQQQPVGHGTSSHTKPVSGDGDSGAGGRKAPLSHPIPLRGTLPYGVRTAAELEDKVSRGRGGDERGSASRRPSAGG